MGIDVHFFTAVRARNLRVVTSSSSAFEDLDVLIARRPCAPGADRAPIRGIVTRSARIPRGPAHGASFALSLCQMATHPITVVRRHVFFAALGLAASCIGAGCQPAAPRSAAQPAERPLPPPPEGPWIIGRVVVGGAGPEKKPPRGGVVYLEDAPKQPGVATATTIEIDHKDFSPFISVITTGGIATFANKDSMMHHVFSTDIAKWDTGNLAQNVTSQRTFDTVGPVALLCNIHQEMLGYLYVVPSTYFGTVNVDGTYVIQNVPPGRYQATAWAPRMLTVTQSVTVGTSGESLADFELVAATK